MKRDDFVLPLLDPAERGGYRHRHRAGSHGKPAHPDTERLLTAHPPVQRRIQPSSATQTGAGGLVASYQRLVPHICRTGLGDQA